MNKAYFMSFVLAAALPAMATEDTYSNTYTNFLTGVKSIAPETGVPTAEGGTWIREGVSLTNSNDKVDFETSSSPLKLTEFTPGPDDTNTIVKVELEVSVADVGELMTSNELADAQTAFAVCTNAYHAWNGTAWVVLGDTIAEVGDDSLTTNLTVEISYLGSNSTVRARMARFTIGDTTLVARGASTDLERAGWVALATPSNNFTGFGASGSGLLSRVDAEVMLGIAEYKGVKYGTLAEAIDTAIVEGKSAPVEVLRETKESITLHEGASGIKIADNGKVSGTITADESVDVNIQPSKEDFTSTELAGKDGEYTIPVKVSGGNVSVKLPETMSNKEIVLGSIQHDGSTVKVTIQTARTVLAGARPDGSKALSTEGAREAALRKYLSDNLNDAYVDANVSSTTLATALAGDSSNGLKHYQNYAIGITPADSVKPVAVAKDTDAGNITLAIPAINPEKASGDYVIKYQVDSGDLQTDAGSIKIPLTTGSHTVKIVFAEPEP